MSVLDADHVAAASAAMTLPLRAGAAGGVLALRDGRIEVGTAHRHPVLLLRLRRPLIDERLLVRVSVAGESAPTLVFAPYSHEGTTLPALAPVTSGDLAGPFAVDIEGRYSAGDAAWSPADDGAPLTPADLAELVQARLLTGVTGKLLLLGALEKQRLVAQGREVVAGRSLALARRSALDLLGQDLGVPRRRDLAETDADYRARLAIYRRFRLPTPAAVRDALNGPGGPTDPNVGLPALVGIEHRFSVVEQVNPLSVALRLVAVGGPEPLDELHRQLRAHHLLDLRRRPSAALPPALAAAREADRQTIRDLVELPGDRSVRHLHPGAARCLARAARLWRAAGVSTRPALVRAYDPAGGSDHELGLGLGVKRPADRDLEQLADGITALATDRAGLGGADAALVQGMAPREPAHDPLGAWFWHACGLATVVERTDGLLLLSPFPMRGLTVDGPGALDVGDDARYRARYVGTAVGGVHRLAAAAADAVPAALASTGAPAPTRVVAGAQLPALLAAVGAASGAPPAIAEPLRAAGLVPAENAAYADTLATAADLDLAVGFAWDATRLPGAGDVLAAVTSWADALVEAGFSSVRGLWDLAGDRLLLVASVTQLPGARSVPGRPPAAAYWWTQTGVGAREGLGRDRHPLRLRPDGPTAVRARGRTPGVALLAVVGYHRVGLADPYEVKIELDDPRALLSADQYGYVMNLLDELHPLGIEINTFDLRRRHVDADGDGQAQWLTSRASRSYHQYRQTRWSRRCADRTSQRGTPWPST